MLFTNSGKNDGYPKPQKPHQDFITTECERETPMPCGMIMSLFLGGNCLNKWDNCVDEKHAIHLSIPFKFIFLMRGDIVHGGALDKSLKNGALQIHFYLSPVSIKQRNGHSVAKLKQQDNNIHTDGSICGRNQKFSSFLLQHA
jgi:hypothetical protein